MKLLIFLLTSYFTFTTVAFDFKTPIHLEKSFNKASGMTFELSLPIDPEQTLTLNSYQPYSTILVEGTPDELSVEISELPRTFVDLKFDFSHDLMYRLQDGKTLFANRDSILSHPEYRVESVGEFRGIALSRITILSMQIEGERASFSPRMQINLNRAEVNIDELIKPLLNTKINIFVNDSRAVEVMKPLIQKWEQEGFDPEVTEVKGTFAEIKAQIKSVYVQREFTHAVIVGDEKQFPTEMVDTSGSSMTPSDLKYFCFGEGDDFIPDVVYARFPIALNQSSIAVSKNVVWKASTGVALALASNQGSNPSDIDYSNDYLKNLKMKSVLITQNMSNSTPDGVRSVIKSGVDVITAIGHGSGTSYASLKTGGFSVSDVKKIDQASHSFVYLDATCLNGRFQPGMYGYELFNYPAGAVGYLGGSVSISWHPPGVFLRTVTSEMTSSSIGIAILKGQLTLLKNWEVLEEARDNFEWYHYFGDPTLKLK